MLQEDGESSGLTTEAIYSGFGAVPRPGGPFTASVNLPASGLSGPIKSITGLLFDMRICMFDAESTHSLFWSYRRAVVYPYNVQKLEFEQWSFTMARHFVSSRINKWSHLQYCNCKSPAGLCRRCLHLPRMASIGRIDIPYSNHQTSKTCQLPSASIKQSW